MSMGLGVLVGAEVGPEVGAEVGPEVGAEVGPEVGAEVGPAQEESQVAVADATVGTPPP